MAHNPSPFLRLPAEIRIMIYELLLLPATTSTPPSPLALSTRQLLHQDHHDHDHPFPSDPYTLSIRTLDPFSRNSACPSTAQTLRSTYSIRGGRFRACTLPTTYTVLVHPSTTHLRWMAPNLLSVNRQVHAEAAALLYSAYTFSFGTAIEAIIPFFSDLTPLALASVRKIQLTKRALPYVKEFDRAEWGAACEFLARTPKLKIEQLELGVVAGRPAGPIGWEGVEEMAKEDFEGLVRARKRWGSAGHGVDLEWVEQLMVVRGVKDVRIRAIVEVCPPPKSEIMAFWVAVSKSVEGGFGKWVREVMVGA